MLDGEVFVDGVIREVETFLKFISINGGEKVSECLDYLRVNLGHFEIKVINNDVNRIVDVRVSAQLEE